MIRRIIAAIVLTLCLAGAPASVALAAYNPLQGACTGTGEQSSACQASNNPDTITGNNGIILKAAGLIATIAGVAVVIVVIISGLMFITSNGDSQRAASARNALIYSLIGLVVIVLARVIILFIIART